MLAIARIIMMALPIASSTINSDKYITVHRFRSGLRLQLMNETFESMTDLDF